MKFMNELINECKQASKQASKKERKLQKESKMHTCLPTCLPTYLQTSYRLPTDYLQTYNETNLVLLIQCLQELAVLRGRFNALPEAPVPTQRWDTRRFRRILSTPENAFQFSHDGVGDFSLSLSLSVCVSLFLYLSLIFTVGKLVVLQFCFSCQVTFAKHAHWNPAPKDGTSDLFRRALLMSIFAASRHEPTNPIFALETSRHLSETTQ